MFIIRYLNNNKSGLMAHAFEDNFIAPLSTGVVTALAQDCMLCTTG